MEKTYRVIITDRQDVTNNHYQVLGGLTEEEILKDFQVSKEDFDNAVEEAKEIDRGYLGKDGLNEYELEIEK